MGNEDRQSAQKKWRDIRRRESGALHEHQHALDKVSGFDRQRRQVYLRGVWLRQPTFQKLGHKGIEGLGLHGFQLSWVKMMEPH
jgi:hypothetical protein